MDFLERLLAPAPPGFDACLTLWFLPSRQSLHVPLADLDGIELEHILAAAPEGTKHVYFCPGLRAPYMAEGDRPERKRGRKKDVIAITAVLNDIDLFDPEYPEAHKAQNLPTSLDDAEPLILIPGRPEPNLIINSGNGLYSGHVFDRAIYFHENQHRTLFQKFYKAYQKPSIEAAAERGWQMDSKATVQEVFRLPGPPNGKTGKPTEVLHFDGQVAPEDIGFELPAEMFHPVFDPSLRTTVLADIGTFKPATDEELEEIRTQLKYLSKTNPYDLAIRKLLDGVSFAPRGKRDHIMQGVCATISAMPAAKGKTAETLASLFVDSLAVWVAEPDAEKTLEEELEKVVDKITRSQEDLADKYSEKVEREKPAMEGIARVASKYTGKDPSIYFQGIKPHDPEAARVAAENTESEEDGEEDEPPAFDPEELAQRAIIANGTIYWVYDLQSESYTPSIKGESNMLAVCRDCWGESEFLKVTYLNDKMRETLKPLPKIRHEYSTHAHHVLGNLLLEKSYYDPDTSTFHEALASFAVKEAEYSELVDLWLQKLAGDAYESLKLWLARFPRLDLNQSALYLDGVSHAGKSMLARGLARLWGATDPTELAQIINEDFNDTLVKCPMLWIDEGLSLPRKFNASQFIRSLLSQRGFSLNEKNKPRRPVEGCVRLVICANNDSVLSFGEEDITVQDMDAIQDRFFHLPVQQEAADWLRGEGSVHTRLFVENGAIAKHVLHLSQTLGADENDRFGPTNGETRMHRNMVMEGQVNSQIFEWLVRYADNPKRLEMDLKTGHKPPYALIGQGQILVNSSAIADYWKTYMGDERKPNVRSITKTVARLSHGVRKLGQRGQRVAYHQIDPRLVLEWSQRNQVGLTEQIIQNIERNLDDGLLVDDSVADQKHQAQLKKYLH